MNEHDLVDVILKYGQFVFLYIFKYLADIKKLLNTLHTDNKLQDSEIKHLKSENIELKGWIRRVETEIRTCKGCEHLKK